jgi:PleD family two-component response regulator
MARAHKDSGKTRTTTQSGFAESRRLLGSSAAKEILIVDASDHARMLRSRLEEMGHAVVIARDSATALDLVRSFKPHLAMVASDNPSFDASTLGTGVLALSEKSMSLVAYGSPVSNIDELRLRDAGFRIRIRGTLNEGAIDHIVRETLGES